jgi:molecular chaperone GrpE (heat shock protein)
VAGDGRTIQIFDVLTGERLLTAEEEKALRLEAEAARLEERSARLEAEAENARLRAELERVRKS